MRDALPLVRSDLIVRSGTFRWDMHASGCVYTKGVIDSDTSLTDMPFCVQVTFTMHILGRICLGQTFAGYTRGFGRLLI